VEQFSWFLAWEFSNMFSDQRYASEFIIFILQRLRHQAKNNLILLVLVDSANLVSDDKESSYSPFPRHRSIYKHST
jgi:hypothetical protein